MKPLKKTAITLLGLLSVLALILVTIPLFVDINQYKPEIENVLKKQAHIEVKINGEIKLSLFPWVGVGINDLTIKDSESFGDSPLFRAKYIQLKAKFFPLLKRQIEMRTATLDGIKIKLVTLRDGTTNLDPIFGSSAPTSSNSEAEKPTSEPKNTAALAAFSLGGLNINNAELSYVDQTSGTHLKIEGISLTSSALSPSQPAEINGHAVFFDHGSQTKSDITLSSILSFSNDFSLVELNELTVQAKLNHPELNKPVTVSLTGSSKADLSKQDLTAQLALNIETLNLSLSINGRDILKTPAFSGSLTLAEFNARSFIEEYLEKLNLNNDTALSKAAFSSQFKVTEKQLNLSKVALQLDETRLQGHARLLLAKPHYDFNFSGNSFNVDRYLPKTNEPKSQQPQITAIAATPSAATLLPVEFLKMLSMRGKLSLQSLFVSELQIENFLLEISAKDSIVKIAPLTAELYEGYISSETVIDASGETPRLSTTHAINQVQAGPIVKVLMGKKLVTGSANVNATFSTTGNTEQDILNALTGDVRFNFADGAVHGINVAETIRNAKAKLSGTSHTPNTTIKKTDFTELFGALRIKDNRIVNKTLSLKSPYLRMRGHGNVDIKRETINYLTDVKLTGTPEGQNGKDLEDLVGLTIPFRIGGTFDNPSYYPDLKRIIKKQTTKKVREKIQNEIKKKIGVDLKNLF